MTASEKLTQLIENDKLTDDQLDNLNDWGVQKVSDLRDYLIDLIYKLKNETYSVGYEEAVCALSDLLDYAEDEYVVYDENVLYGESSVQKLDFDTLDDLIDAD